jgi:hypothetical protein
MAQSFLAPDEAVTHANMYAASIIQRAEEGDRSTLAEVEALMKNPSHPYYAAVSSHLCKLMAIAFGWGPLAEYR